MKVLLVNPFYPFSESPTPPFGLMAIGAYLLEHGIEAKIEDYIITPFSKERVKKVLDEYKPDVVGATSVTMNVKTALKTVKAYKEANPDIVTVMGGPHVSFDADDILKEHPYVDFIVRGEGEITFHELLEKIDSKSSVKDVLGISYMEKGKVINNPQRPFIDDINILPYPARHLVSLSRYKSLGIPVNMITSRGCPYKCIFCVGSKMIGQKVRYFDVKRVVDEFEMLSKMGFYQINVVDDLFTANKKRCMEICDEILRRGIKQTWNGFARVDTVSRELLLKMKEAGCNALCFGVESGNQEILDRIKKKITLQKIRDAIELSLEVGMDPMASFIMGLPGETHETVKQSLEFGKSLCKTYGYHILSPFPGTEVREKADEYGLKILTNDWDKYDANQSVSETQWISAKEIDDVVNKFFGYIEDRIKEIRTKFKNGEPLEEGDRLYAENAYTLDITRDIIHREFIEGYPGLANGGSKDAALDDLAKFIKKDVEYSLEDVRKRVQRLVDLKCVKFDTKQGVTTISWS
ncbi:MAG: B12-binding domain-containing radical SAM protein [Spirochaetes bacterium]|jgi:radical SAM superfamily enzyme YgiQ (UPF0313 family)|nr:B12-binding domain-containing radical SAM protein [Spirochaetota bacterium]